MKICFATHNENKLREVKAMLPEDWEVFGLTEAGIHDEIVEDGDTIEENSHIKAQHVYDNTGQAAFADDTGLEVDALEGAPGVYSARYAGPQKNSEENIRLLLKNLDGKDRKASFLTVITFIDEKGSARQFEGRIPWTILKNPVGENGFGYDPVFQPDGYDISFAEMDGELKNQISHRAIAFRNLVAYLKESYE